MTTQQHYQLQRVDPNAMEVDLVDTYTPAPRKITTLTPKALQHGQTCYLCRKKGHYAKDCPYGTRATTVSWSAPGDQSINTAQPCRWANSRLRTTPPTTQISWSTPGYQSTGNTTTKQYTNGPLLQTTTTLPRSRPGYQSHRNNHDTQQLDNETPQNNIPSAPPSYRTNSRTPSPTLPQSALGEQSYAMEQTRHTDTRTQNTSNGFVAKAPMETTRITTNETQKIDTMAQTMAQPTEFITISFVAKEIWLEFDLVTCKGMIQEKALVDSGANENCMDIKTAQKLGIKP
jgi:Zinc knuckle